MSKVKLVQCLCPERHCITAIAFQDLPESEAISKLQSIVDSSIASSLINPWCAICGSRKWHYEVGKTRFSTMEEAEPELAKTEVEQRKTIALLKSLGLTFDKS